MSNIRPVVYRIIPHIAIIQVAPNMYPVYENANGKPSIPAPMYDLNRFTLAYATVLFS